MEQIYNLDFYGALREVASGKRIHKLEWEDKEFYGVLKDGRLQIHKPDDKFYDWIISDGDMNGDDYMTL
jgi:hypothetical protein